jgi:hypothetical protein
MADQTSRAVRLLVIGGIALAGIGLLSNLSTISRNALLYWTLTACLLLLAGFCFVKGVMMLNEAMQNQPKGTAMGLDRNIPQGKLVIVLMSIGLIALFGNYFLDYFVPQSNPHWLVITCVLTLIFAVCFIPATLIMRKARREAAAKGVKK